MRRPDQLARLVPGRLYLAAFVCLGIVAALAVARPWLPPETSPRIGFLPQFLCALLTAAICLRRGRATGWAARFLGLSHLTYALGVSIAFGVAFRGGGPTRTVPADIAYLLACPLFVLAIVSLPRRRLPLATLGRIALDGVMIMLAICTFSWFFFLGPLVEQGRTLNLTTLVAFAYPLGDLLTGACALLILSPANDIARPVKRLLIVSILLVLAANTAHAFQIAAGTLVPGGPLDLVRLTAHLLSAFAITTMQRRETETLSQPDEVVPSPLGWTLLPYAFLMAVIVLLLHARSIIKLPILLDGTRLITGVLIVTILLRQLVTMLENARLQRTTTEHAHRLRVINAALQHSQVTLQASNDELARANERLEALATTDALTSLPNHRATAAAVEAALAQAREQAQPCTILFFDIDHFKEINDTHGHAAGDSVLRELAVVARTALREGDYVGRWGGEEFVAILHDTPPPDAATIAERLRTLVATHHFGVGDGLQLTCSIGLASTPQDGLTSAEVLHRADLAMYLAKHLGRNRVCVVAEDVAKGMSGPSLFTSDPVAAG